MVELVQTQDKPLKSNEKQEFKMGFLNQGDFSPESDSEGFIYRFKLLYIIIMLKYLYPLFHLPKKFTVSWHS